MMLSEMATMRLPRSMAALRSSGRIEISDCANVDTSFPGFVELANPAGVTVKADS